MASTEHTTFVLGAGASTEVGLPVGEELKARISQLLKLSYEHGFRRSGGSGEVDDAFRIKAKADGEQDINSYLHACRDICNAMPQAISIDNYLDAHAGNKKVELSGKLGIAKAILDAELVSTLSFRRETSSSTLDFNRIRDTWFAKFFQTLTENCRIDDLQDRLSEVKIISFNYDRCLLHYLYFALQNYYKIDDPTASTLLSNLEVFHPYGKVGHLPWQNKQGKAMAFGAKASSRDLLDLAAEIRTFTEGTDPKSSQIGALRECLSNSKRLVFLGFAYHKINMSLLRSEQSNSTPQWALGTAFGISDSDCELIKRDISSLVGRFGKDDSARREIAPIWIRNTLTCAGLFDEHRRRLSFE